MEIKKLYRVVAEVTKVDPSGQLAFGFCRTGASEDEDWVGASYVFAVDKDEAMMKLEEFFRRNAVEWTFEGEPEIVSNLSDFEMDFDVISRRGDVPKLEERGMVVVGWGM